MIYNVEGETASKWGTEGSTRSLHTEFRGKKERPRVGMDLSVWLGINDPGVKGDQSGFVVKRAWGTEKEQVGAWDGGTFRESEVYLTVF